jgi:hypothetical protein
MFSYIPKGPMAKYTKGYFTNMPLDKGETMKHIIYSNTLSNSRWIKYIEFGKKKTMLSSSMSLGK